MYTLKHHAYNLAVAEAKLKKMQNRVTRLQETRASFVGSSVGNQLGELRRFEKELRQRYSRYTKKYVHPKKTWANDATSRWYHEVLANKTLFTYHDMLNQVRGEIERLRWIERQRHQKIRENKHNIAVATQKVAAQREKIAGIKEIMRKFTQ